MKFEGETLMMVGRKSDLLVKERSERTRAGQHIKHQRLISDSQKRFFLSDMNYFHGKRYEDVLDEEEERRFLFLCFGREMVYK